MKRWMALLGIGTLAFVVGAAAQDELPDYDQYRVLEVQELDLYAAPENTAVHLSPDGTQFAHFAGGAVCFYTREGDEWVEDRCFELDREVFAGSPEDVNWSPDGRHMTAPTFRRALLYVEDTDLQVLEASTGEAINLTDDGVDGDLLSKGAEGNLDLAPVWLDNDSLLFIRYAQAPESAADDSLLGHFLPGAVYRIDLSADGSASEAEFVMDLSGDRRLLSYLLATEPESGRTAVNVDEMDESPFTYEVWQNGPEGEPFEWLASLGETPIRHLSYSADGDWLMAIQPEARTAAAAISLISVTTGEVVTPDLEMGDFVEPRLIIAGWAPTGNALAYIVRDDGNPDASGLYISPAPGEPGQLILPGEFYGTTCCMGMAIRWAANDVIAIGRGAESGVLLVQVGT